MFFIFLPFLTPHSSLASEMLIFAILVLAFDLCFGYTGIPSLGHAIFFGLGAYGLALTQLKFQAPFLIGFFVGVFLSLTSALIVGFLSLRRKGIYFVMITLAFNQIFYFTAFKWESLTGGENGLHGIVRPPIGPINLNSEINFYYFVFCIFATSFFLISRIVNSPFGKVLQSLKDNEGRAKSIGFNIDNFKLVSFLMSAFFSSLAGSLYALHLNFVPVDTFHWMISGDVMMMCLIGGIGTLYGPVFGAMLLVYLKTALSNWTLQWNLILGALFVVSILTCRNGILKEFKERVLERVSRTKI
jgi:branched-chain amino acid transport system permease protein